MRVNRRSKLKIIALENNKMRRLLDYYQKNRRPMLTAEKKLMMELWYIEYNINVCDLRNSKDLKILVKKKNELLKQLLWE